MTYATLSRQVRLLWDEARHGYALDPVYRAWIVERVTDKLTVAELLNDGALDHYRDHLAFDYRIDETEAGRFTFWWQHITEKGFTGLSPFTHLHRKKVGAK